MSLAAQLEAPAQTPAPIMFQGKEIFLKEDWFSVVKSGVVDRPPTEEEIAVTIRVFKIVDTAYCTAKEQAIKCFGGYRFSPLLGKAGGRSAATYGRGAYGHSDGCR